MSELRIILKREFTERVRSKSFIVSTVLIPVFILAVFLVPILMEALGQGAVNRITVVDEGPVAVGEAVVARLGAPPRSERDDRFVVEHLRAPLASVRDSLNLAVTAEAIDGYLWIPQDVVARSEVEYRGRSVTDTEVQERLGAVVSEAVQAARLNEAGLRITDVATLLQPVRVEAARITREGEEGGSAVAGIVFAGVIGFTLYMLIILYGAQVMQSVQEEKTNRIAEVLVSSVRASHLMLGKVLGVGLVALLQVALWGGFGALLASQRGRISEALGVPARAVTLLSMEMEPLLLVALLLYSMFGFFLYAALFAAAGAAADSSEDAQRFTFPLIMPLMIPIFTFQQIISDPGGTLATTLGWIPFTSPIVMPMRMGAGGISPLEIVGALVVLAASVFLLGILAGKIYRIGILSTGKRPTLREIGRWLRTA